MSILSVLYLPICQTPMVVLRHRKLIKVINKKGVKMTHLNIGQEVWCDNCTEPVIAIDGEEYGVICPTCQTGFYLETL